MKQLEIEFPKVWGQTYESCLKRMNELSQQNNQIDEYISDLRLEQEHNEVLLEAIAEDLIKGRYDN